MADADLRVIGAETLAQFIARHGGVANTVNVASRFGWNVREAKRRLEAAAKDGIVQKIAAHDYGTAGGRVCSWKLTDPDAG